MNRLLDIIKFSLLFLLFVAKSLEKSRREAFLCVKVMTGVCFNIQLQTAKGK